MPPKPRTIEASRDEPEALPKLIVRDRVAEKRVAKGKQALRLRQLLDDRNTGKLGDEVIKKIHSSSERGPGYRHKPLRCPPPLSYKQWCSHESGSRLP